MRSSHTSFPTLHFIRDYHRLRAKNHCKINVMTALTNLYLARGQLLAAA